jgi:hypothetical protein
MAYRVPTVPMRRIPARDISAHACQYKHKTTEIHG